MNVSIDLTDLIVGIITVIIGLVCRHLIPYIKSQLDSKTFDNLKAIVKVAVEAAEQLFRESGKGREKKDYVVTFLETNGFFVDEAIINNLIESAVLELKKDSAN